MLLIHIFTLINFFTDTVIIIMKFQFIILNCFNFMSGAELFHKGALLNTTLRSQVFDPALGGVFKNEDIKGRVLHVSESRWGKYTSTHDKMMLQIALSKAFDIILVYSDTTIIQELH